MILAVDLATDSDLGTKRKEISVVKILSTVFELGLGIGDQ